jgi:hypothetical protein
MRTASAPLSFNTLPSDIVSQTPRLDSRCCQRVLSRFWRRAELLGSRSDLLRAALRRVLSSYSLCYNETRTHLGLAKNAASPRAVQRSWAIIITPILSGLHHRYARISFSGRTVSHATAEEAEAEKTRPRFLKHPNAPAKLKKPITQTNRPSTSQKRGSHGNQWSRIRRKTGTPMW